MVAVHREVERKYDVPGSFRVPDLAGVGPVAAVEGPVEHTLEATYFDTPDHRLHHARTTLRRRTGGADDGWHLKLPAGPDARSEVREALGSDGAVPATLAALARATSRGAPLGPVLALRTVRSVYRLHAPASDGSAHVLAEVADDRVTAEVPGAPVTSWREVEVELVTGAPGVLEAVEAALLAAGAVPAGTTSKAARALGDRRSPSGEVGRRSTAGEVVGAYVRQHVEELVRQDPLVRLDLPESVHDMRVATRRLRSVLAAFRPLYDRAVTDPIRDELAWLGGVLGTARDAEVLRERLAGALAGEPGDVPTGPVRARVEADLSGEYREGHDKILAALDGERYLGLLAALDALVTAPPSTGTARKRATAVLPPRVRRTWRRLREAERRVAAAEPAHRDEALHDMRKAAKRARYAAEAAEPVFGTSAARFRDRMKQLQTHLGELQDSVAARAGLRAMAARAFLAGENGFPYGRLHALEQVRGEAVAGTYAGVWRKASAKRVRRWLR